MLDELKTWCSEHHGRQVEFARSLDLPRQAPAKVTSHHFFDCGGGIVIGDLCCVGGRDAQFWTHYLTAINKTAWRELTIDDRCYVGARATLVYCRIPADSVVGAGAVVTKDFSKEGTGLLLAGNPAEVRKRQGKVL